MALSRLAKGIGQVAPGPVGGIANVAGDILGILGLKRAMAGGSRKKRKAGGKKKGGKGKNARKKSVRRAAPRRQYTTAGAGNAPLAIARTIDLKPYFRCAPSDAGDGLIVHSVDFINPLTSFSATAGAWQANIAQGLTPSNASIHPWLATMATLFQKWKLKMLKLHYEHFCATTIQGEVTLQFFPDPAVNPATITSAQSLNASNYMTGACYEDFSFQADLKGVDPNRWMNTETTLGTNQDISDLQVGVIGVYTANGIASQPSTGNLWIECIYEFNSRKMNTVSVGLSKARQVIMNPRIKPQDKKDWLHRAIDQVIDEVHKPKVAMKDLVQEMVELSLTGTGPVLKL